MNASDILKYGNLTYLRTIEGLSPEDWLANGVCGWWSAKDILAHLTSFECVLVELFQNCLGERGQTPTLDQFKSMRGDDFNAVQVEARKNKTVQQVLDEYKAMHARTMEQVARIQADTLVELGSLPWYGKEYALDDFIVYTYYGHKREHSAQVMVYRDRIKR